MTDQIKKAPEEPLQTRADLMRLPEFAELSVDTSGNPCVWRNHYACPCGCAWEDEWSSQVDDECGECGTTVTPQASIWIGPETRRDDWEKLPEKG